MKRRELLATTGIGIGSIAGCLGNRNNSTDDTSGDGASVAEDSCPGPIGADGLIGETVGAKGVEYKVEDLYTADTYKGYSENNTLEGATFGAVQISATVTADTQRRISGHYLLEPHYKGLQMNKLEVVKGEITIDGTSLTMWRRKTGSSGTVKYPGESIKGAFLFDIPIDFTTADLRLSLWPTENVRRESMSDESDKLHIRGEGEPNTQFCINEEPPTKVQIGNAITFGGLRISVVDFTTAKTLNQEGWEREADEGAVYLAPKFSIENVSSVPRSLPDPIAATYAEREARGVPELQTENFTINGSSYTALYNGDRDGQKTDGYRIFPGVSIEGGLGFKVPEQFDENKLSITMETGGETIQWKV